MAARFHTTRTAVLAPGCAAWLRSCLAIFCNESEVFVHHTNSIHDGAGITRTRTCRWHRLRQTRACWGWASRRPSTLTRRRATSCSPRSVIRRKFPACISKHLSLCGPVLLQSALAAALSCDKHVDAATDAFSDGVEDRCRCLNTCPIENAKNTSACVQVENMAYPVTVDPLHTVFSPYGTVQKMAIFEKNNQWQVRACARDTDRSCNAAPALGAVQAVHPNSARNRPAPQHRAAA